MKSQRLPKTQVFPDGRVKIYSIKNIGQPGRAPKESLELRVELPYKTKTIGYARQLAAMQIGSRVDMLVECPAVPTVMAGDAASLSGHRLDPAERYSVELVSFLEDAVPPVMRLQLKKTDQRLDFEDGAI